MTAPVIEVGARGVPASPSIEELRPLIAAVVREVAPDLVRQMVAGAPRVPPMVKITAVAATAGVSVATLNRWVKEGFFPAPDAWLGLHRVWKIVTVEKWIAEQATAPRPRQKPRGVATWTREQHAEREREKAMQRRDSTGRGKA
jgi:hypothetical protein